MPANRLCRVFHVLIATLRRDVAKIIAKCGVIRVQAEESEPDPFDLVQIEK